jgi:hypothetical protein
MHCDQIVDRLAAAHDPPFQCGFDRIFTISLNFDMRVAILPTVRNSYYSTQDKAGNSWDLT